jgi:hypothetical protein
MSAASASARDGLPVRFHHFRRDRLTVRTRTPAGNLTADTPAYLERRYHADGYPDVVVAAFVTATTHLCPSATLVFNGIRSTSDWRQSPAGFTRRERQARVARRTRPAGRLSRVRSANCASANRPALWSNRPEPAKPSAAASVTYATRCRLERAGGTAGAGSGTARRPRRRFPALAPRIPAGRSPSAIRSGSPRRARARRSIWRDACAHKRLRRIHGRPLYGMLYGPATH